MRRNAIIVTAGLLYALALLAVFTLSLVLLDRYYFADIGKAPLSALGDQQGSGPVDPRFPDRTVATLDFYPFTGGHTQGNAVIESGGRRIVTGDHGFMIDFDLDDPPPLQLKVFRVLWTGGSGAAGWGASHNDAMLYRLLEKAFVLRNPCSSRIETLEVINLAMGGSISYQNFIALNRWGHALKPGAIISFSGHNDMDPVYSRSETWRGYETIAALSYLARADAAPQLAGLLSRWIPNISRGTGIDIMLRAEAIPNYVKLVQERMRKAFPSVAETTEAGLGIAIKSYAAALASMKRDFPAIPLIVIQQPYMATDAQPGRSASKLPLSREAWLHYYARLFEAVSSLPGQNAGNGWHFIDLQGIWRNEMASRFAPGDGVHMNDEVQAAIAERLARILFPIFCEAAPA